MTLLDLASRSRENILSTYLAVGKGFPGAEYVEKDGYVALLSDLSHPSGNFAVNLNLDPWSAAGLRALAASRPAFQVVALSGDGPDHLPELLRRAGFEVVQRMIGMVAEASSENAPLEMMLCEEIEQRRLVGRFMADTFFARESPALRDTMAEAIVEATSLTVHAHFVRDRPVAAVSLAPDSELLGIYNLCVARTQQGKGVGSSLVNWCLAQATSEHRIASLQCMPSLELWYERHGFVRTDTITFWSPVTS